MPDKPTETERTVLFGNGCQAELGGCYENAKDNKMVFMFRPTAYMRWKENIGDDQYDKTWWWIKKSYPKDLCVCLDYSYEFMKWLLFCDYWGNKCDLTQKINQELLAKLQGMKSEKDAWQTLATVLPLKLRKAIAYPEEAVDSLLERFARQKKVIGTELFPQKEKEGEKGGD